ncbi:MULTISPECIES: restriction endonuclease subunit S [Massilimicrobiota]|uniref:restriction endonuclease subunit S n=1 Tax=Massilimicrobiota TaxID=1924110 RepID=UPI0013029984|nr:MULTISPECIES: restriction endonuclease subunit S [Massilimicrobiota]
MNLNDKKWKEFHFSSFVNSIDRGKVKDLSKIDVGETAVIAAAGANEGISTFANCNKKYKNAMTISLNGVGTGTAFVHNYSFNLNSDCGVVITGSKMSIDVLRFFQCCINMHKNKFSYGYKANETRLKRQIILLPVKDNNEPDFEYMEHYIKEIKFKKKEEYVKFCKNKLDELGKEVSILPLNKIEWKEFFVTDIFNKPMRGKRIISANYIDGDKPVVSSAGGNNGVIAFVGNKYKIREYENCLSVANGGVSAGFAFYHPYKFIATDHITHFKGQQLNKYHYLFLGTVIRNQMHTKYDFSREMTDPRLQREKIIIPITKEGNPDYSYMEQYIKNIMIRKYSEYLSYLERD